MSRKPNPLLKEFLEDSLTLPEIDWETVPFGVNPRDAWEMFVAVVGNAYTKKTCGCFRPVTSVLRSEQVLSESLKRGVVISYSRDQSL
jgi:hypothetical protein